MLELGLGIAFALGVVVLAWRSFRRPHGVFRRSATGAGLAVAGIWALALLVGALASDAAGLGLFLIAMTLSAAVLGVAVLACIAAAAGLVRAALAPQTPPARN